MYYLDQNKRRDWLFKHKYFGEEYDWISSDSFGNLGFFSTGGFGPIPKIFEDLDEVIWTGTIEELDLINYKTEIEWKIKVDHDISDWLKAAGKGFYSYDWSHYCNKYYLVATPSIPLKLKQLPNKIIEIITKSERHDGLFRKNEREL